MGYALAFFDLAAKTLNSMLGGMRKTMWGLKVYDTDGTLIASETCFKDRRHAIHGAIDWKSGTRFEVIKPDGSIDHSFRRAAQHGVQPTGADAPESQFGSVDRASG